jgi:hypothetical protein
MSTLDHCTLWPDRLLGADWSQCCAAHDLAYLEGLPRLDADFDLVACVATVNPLMAALMGAGVIAFGWLFYPRKSDRK